MHPILFLVDHLMIPMLKYGYEITGSYGLAIVLVTIFIKVALFPLTLKQTQSMAGMKILQPKIKELQEKYKDNPQMVQVKMMELYKEHKINPLGGCLPTLLQLPFFLAIFVALNSKGFQVLMATSGASSAFLWMPNLSLPDKTMILPILVAASTYLSQMTMSPGMAKDDPQMKILAYMPVLMFFISMSMPSGVLIYWALSQFIAALQQYLINLKRPKPASSDMVIEAKVVAKTIETEKKEEGKILAKVDNKKKKKVITKKFDIY